MGPTTKIDRIYLFSEAEISCFFNDQNCDSFKPLNVKPIIFLHASEGVCFTERSKGWGEMEKLRGKLSERGGVDEFRGVRSRGG